MDKLNDWVILQQVLFYTLHLLYQTYYIYVFFKTKKCVGYKS